MKPLLFITSALLSFGLFAQPIKLENLTYGKKVDISLFGGENLFKVISEEKITISGYDKSLATITFDSNILKIDIIHRVKYPERKSNWDGKNSELPVVFSTKTGEQTIVFKYKRMPLGFVSLAGNPERGTIAKNDIPSNKKITISTTTPDTIGYFTDFKVQKFQVLINDKTFSVIGDELSDEALVAIAAAKTGDKLTLQEVDAFNDVVGKKLKFGTTIYTLK
jgi:hypothetical protein